MPRGIVGLGPATTPITIVKVPLPGYYQQLRSFRRAANAIRFRVDQGLHGLRVCFFFAFRETGKPHGLAMALESQSKVLAYTFSQQLRNEDLK